MASGMASLSHSCPTPLPPPGLLRNGPGHQQVKDKHPLGLACTHTSQVLHLNSEHDCTSENTCLNGSWNLQEADGPSLPNVSERQGPDHQRERKASFRGAHAPCCWLSGSGEWAWLLASPSGLQQWHSGSRPTPAESKPHSLGVPLGAVGWEIRRKTDFILPARWIQTVMDFWGNVGMLAECHRGPPDEPLLCEGTAEPQNGVAAEPSMPQGSAAGSWPLTAQSRVADGLAWRGHS